MVEFWATLAPFPPRRERLRCPWRHRNAEPVSYREATGARDRADPPPALVMSHPGCPRIDRSRIVRNRRGPRVAGAKHPLPRPGNLAFGESVVPRTETDRPLARLLGGAQSQGVDRIDRCVGRDLGPPVWRLARNASVLKPAELCGPALSTRQTQRLPEERCQAAQHQPCRKKRPTGTSNVTS